MDDARRDRMAILQHLVELLFRDLLGRLLAERILGDLADLRAHLVEQRAKGAAAGAVADEAFLVLDLEIVAFQESAGQFLRAVRDEPRAGTLLLVFVFLRRSLGLLGLWHVAP